MNNIFATKIKSAREACHLTQQDLASKIGVSRQTINNYESGLREPSLDILAKLIQTLNISFDWLTNKIDSNISNTENITNLTLADKQNLDVLIEQLNSIQRIKNLSDRDCAKELHISIDKYIKIKNGEIVPDILLIMKIANHFGISIDWLLGKHTDIPVEKLIFYKYIPSPYDEYLRCRLIMLRTIFQYSTEDVAFFIKINTKEYEKFESGLADPPVAVMLNLSRLYKLPVESLSLNDKYFLDELKKRFSDITK